MDLDLRNCKLDLTVPIIDLLQSLPTLHLLTTSDLPTSASEDEKLMRILTPLLKQQRLVSLTVHGRWQVLDLRKTEELCRVLNVDFVAPHESWDNDSLGLGWTELLTSY